MTRKQGILHTAVSGKDPIAAGMTKRQIAINSADGVIQTVDGEGSLLTFKSADVMESYVDTVVAGVSGGGSATYPDQTGQGGKILGTDGADVIWVDTPSGGTGGSTTINLGSQVNHNESTMSLEPGADKIIGGLDLAGGHSVAHVKQYVPGDTVSDTKWDFDLIDSNQWDGGSVEGGKIGLFNLSPIKSITEKTPISGMTEGFALSVKGLVLDGTGILRFFMGGYATMGLYIYTDGRLMAGINGMNESSYGFTFAIGTSYDVDIVATAAGAVTVTIDNVLVGTISRSVNFGSATGMFAYNADTPQTFNSFTFDDYSRNYESTSTVTSLSSINTGIATAINGITVAEDKPVGTDAKYALSFDGKTTWTALMDSSELTAFDFSSVTLGDSLDVQMVMSTTDSSVTPTVDQITVDMATQGVWAQASVDPDKFMVIESETNKVSVTNNTDSEKTLKINVGI